MLLTNCIKCYIIQLSKTSYLTYKIYKIYLKGGIKMKKIMSVLLVFVMVFMLVSQIQTAKAAERQKIIFLCEKQEYAQSSVFIEFVLSKQAMGYATDIVVKPEFFTDVEKLRIWLQSQTYFILYAVGNLAFSEIQTMSDPKYPVPKLYWDASLWWPKFKFQYASGGTLPTTAPKILARIPVSSVNELESWLVVKDVVAKEIKGTVVALNLMNTQTSKLFSHYQYSRADNYKQMKELKTDLLKGTDFLVEKRGEDSLSNVSSEKQLDRKSFVESINKTNIGIISGTADQVGEFYYGKNDWLIPTPKLRSNVLSTAYLNQGKIVESDFLNQEDKISGKNRLIILQNFYNSSKDLEFLFKISRCVLSTYPNTLAFDLSQNDLGYLHYNISKKFLQGNIFANAIVDTIVGSAEIKNESKCDLVVWGDPLITVKDLTASAIPPKRMDFGFSRTFSCPFEEDVVFSNIPETTSFERKGKEYVFKSSTPIAGWYFNEPTIIDYVFSFSFKGKNTEGWVFVRMKIFNFWGTIKVPLFYLHLIIFCSIIILLDIN